jgi:hypothetical protein
VQPVVLQTQQVAQALQELLLQQVIQVQLVQPQVVLLKAQAQRVLLEAQRAHLAPSDPIHKVTAKGYLSVSFVAFSRQLL